MSADQLFIDNYGDNPSVGSSAPGRVNLIGEHLDYNGGHVLPYALGQKVEVALASRRDGNVRIVSDRFPGELAEAPLSGTIEAVWAKYAFFSTQLASELGWIDSGLDVAIRSNLSDGAGLSSSAALCVAILKAIRTLRAIEVTDIEIAVLARRVENEKIGMPCGIMDQMAVAVASTGEALFLDTQTLSSETISLPAGVQFLVLHSGIHRKLSDGRYRARKEECDLAKSYFGTDDLCHLSRSDIESAVDLDQRALKRALHCVSEEERTVAAAKALQSADISTFGRLMNESHLSMRDDFEMSVPGIDELVTTAQREGALGARLTGGGFGGAIVACVPAAEASAWSKRVLDAHPEAYIIDEGLSNARDG